MVFCYGILHRDCQCNTGLPAGLRKLAGGKTAPAVAAPGNGLRAVSVLKGRRNERFPSLPPPCRGGFRGVVVPGAALAACPRLISMAPSEPGKSQFPIHPVPPKTAKNRFVGCSQLSWFVSVSGYLNCGEWKMEPRSSCGRPPVLDCGGKRSATPLSHARCGLKYSRPCPPESAVAASLCRRSPRCWRVER